MAPVIPELSGFTYAAEYQSAAPFPHIVLRDFFDAETVREVAREVKQFDFFDGEKDFYGAKKKRYCGSYEKFPPKTKAFLDYCNGAEFRRFLEEMTGETGLQADPYFEGGGIHSLRSGGFLKVHADFNWHARLNLYRRLNLLVYLNEGWQEAWGGHLELWKTDMSGMAARVAPVLGNAVVFTTDDRSFHGHPDPMSCPEEVTRDSIALYYYSEKRPQDAERAIRETTDYRARGVLSDAATLVEKSKERLKSLLRK
jgi:Rps23 Pro-64 3,4-dihydroxylase Tpa1-like proline 4-hydroxylase